MRENRADGTWHAGDEVTFRVKGRVIGYEGTVQIGCKTFTKAEIKDVATDLKVRYPKPPKSGWVSGDAVIKIGGPAPDVARPNETPIRTRTADGEWVAGGTGRLIGRKPIGASLPFDTVDDRVDWEVEQDHYRVLVKGGRAAV